jgi:hypothetical protein
MASDFAVRRFHRRRRFDVHHRLAPDGLKHAHKLRGGALCVCKRLATTTFHIFHNHIFNNFLETLIFCSLVV